MSEESVAMQDTSVRIEIAAENALIIYFGDDTSPQVSDKVQAAVAAIRLNLSSLLIDLVPSYASLLVIYDALKTDHFYIRHSLQKCLIQSLQSQQSADSAGSAEGKLVTLPAYYSEESGPDLTALASNAGLSVEQVIDIHSQQEYRVYAIGFAPGFAYLGEVDERLAAPRLATPRQKVPRGAVAIADRQTAVYPAVSPGGWNLIGLCPQRMFDPAAEPTMPVAVGDRVKFEAISRERFLQLGGVL